MSFYFRLMEHHFDTKVAEQVGVIPAIVYYNIRYWCKKNEANEQHYYDGHYWTYNSLAAFKELFPYLTARQIEYALKKLIDSGFILKGNYSKNPYNKTTWYADIR